MSIVFGTTLQPVCRPLAVCAALFARRMATPLRLVHVSEDSRAPFVLGTDEERVLSPTRTKLEQEAQDLRNSTGADVLVHLAAGSVVDALVSIAEFEMAEALLVGSSVHIGNLLGATAERAARRGAVPVLTLRDPDRLAKWLRGERPLRVLIGADGGRAATAARAFAAGLAALGPTTCEVVHVVSPGDVHDQLGLPAPADPHTLAAEAEEAVLRDLRRAAPPRESAVCRVMPARGGPDAHLVGLADHDDFDLLVVGQRRHSLFEQLWYGSVARGVLRAAPITVASVPARTSFARPAFRQPNVVVVGADDATVESALVQALAMLAPGGTAHLVHVLSMAASSERDARLERERAWYALSKLSVDADGDERELGLNIERHVLEGAPAEQLLALADRVGAELIVLGTPRHAAVGRALFGSVASGVIEASKVPVLLVPLDSA